MSRDQMTFDEMSRDGAYGPRLNFEPRGWQIDCAQSYSESAKDKLPGVQHTFCIYAGTGAGKTKAVGLIASKMLNRRLVDQVVIVCPTKTILRKTQKEFLNWFGIELVKFSKRGHSRGIPRNQQGYIVTYQALMSDPTTHRRLCQSQTLVIFDEVHHLGDEGSWGESAIEAFAHAGYVVALTGTPYRSDNRVIPFVSYDRSADSAVARFRADPPVGFTYSLGLAVSDGVRRNPQFEFHDGEFAVRTSHLSGEILTSFGSTSVSPELSSVCLRGAVSYGSPARREMLRSSLAECKREKRKVIVFLGGDTDGDETPTQDATSLLPQEINDLGYSESDYEIVTGDDPAAQSKIETFGAHPTKWILITIKMVSEGTDIPEISAGVFLTSITAKQTTVQRIGRTLRLMGDSDPHKIARIYMFGDNNLRELAAEIDKEVEQEISLKRKRRETEESALTGDEPRPQRTEVVCLSGGHLSSVVMFGREWPAQLITVAKDRLARNGLPVTTLHAILELMEGPNKP